MREIVVDTETTGLDPVRGDRIVEIACLELHNLVPTGRTFQTYVNPECTVDPDAVDIHGLDNDFLSKAPVFAKVAYEFLAFIGNAPLVIHNADFDMRFINMELSKLNIPFLPETRAKCTLKLARKKYPGAPATLDALCKRFGVDNSNRKLHGALLDCQLLAECYLYMMGGRQPDLMGSAGAASGNNSSGEVNLAALAAAGSRTLPPRPHAPSVEELAAHEAMLKEIKESLWGKV